MTRFGSSKTAICIAILWLAAAAASSAQTFKTLLQFNGTNGGNTYSPLVQGTNGNLFGTSELYGKYSVGNIFEITPTGQFTDVYDFCAKTGCPDGANPNAALILGADGNFYGTTNGGGSGSHGTFFKISLAGQLTTLYNFCSLASCADGSGPGPIVQGPNGNFYGTTGGGGKGAHCPFGPCGTVFEITPAGQLTTIYNFCSQASCQDGYSGYGLILGADGNFYGTAQLGGASQGGTLYRLSPSGSLFVLHSFGARGDGDVPNTPMQATDENLYGTTRGGGEHGDGVVFQFTSKGAYTVLYNFCTLTSCADGEQPEQGLIEGSDGNLYGTTGSGGTHISCGLGQGCGTVFQITSAGVLTTLYDFCATFGCPDGEFPDGAPVQHTNGNLYGNTSEGALSGCVDGCGTIFGLATGLAPFVTPVPALGRAGYTVRILGNNLTSTSAVTFNGIPATFTVRTDTYLSAIVPAGATTGRIEVTTPTGVLSSIAAFHVLP